MPHVIELGWFWLFLPLLAVLTLLPVILWRRKRLLYAAVVSALAALTAALFWYRDNTADEQLSLNIAHDTPNEMSSTGYLLHSSHGGVAFTWRKGITNRVILERYSRQLKSHFSTPTSELAWTFIERQGRYPDLHTFTRPELVRSFDKWGFKGLTFGEPPDPINDAHRLSRVLWFWQLILPDWFLMLLFSILPLLWCRRHLRTRALRRRGFPVSTSSMAPPVTAPQASR